MKAHQLLYTSCRRGRLGTNDGLQVYSFDRGFPIDDIGSLQPTLSYRMPNLPSGVSISDEVISDLPRSFAYRKVHEGLCDISLTTYLGKDYMGPTGRFGNFLAHHMVLEALDAYPAEFFASESFRSSMGFDEVNLETKPPYLDDVELGTGHIISMDTVSMFLREQERLDVLKRMAACLLAKPRDGKRILINDSGPNIIKWIAALHYVLPLRCAENVSFISYLYNPMESTWDIVGIVEEGTLFPPTQPEYVLFDLINGSVPSVSTDTEFSDFLELAFSVSPDSLHNFHAFLDKGYPSYRVADNGMYGALAVYQMSIGIFDPNSLNQALDFLSSHGSEEQNQDYLLKVLEQSSAPDLIGDAGSRNTVLGFLDSLATSADGLLDLCLAAEERLLDHSGSDRATSILWQHFYSRMLEQYPAESLVVYRRFMELGGPRGQQALTLFSLFLQNPACGSPRSQFDGIIGILRSTTEYPPYVNAYFKHATDPAERMHLLEFIMAHNVAFGEAETLVCEAVSTYAYAGMTGADSERILRIWDWAYGCGLDTKKCGRLWGLVTGIFLNEARSADELLSTSKWILDTGDKLGMGGVPVDDAFAKWTIPHVLDGADTPQCLRQVIYESGFKLNQTFVSIVLKYTFSHYTQERWLKVARYVCSLRSRRFDSAFLDACKRLSDKRLSLIDTTVHSGHMTDWQFVTWWEHIYEEIQGSGFRGLKNRLRKRFDGSHDSWRGGRG